MLPKSFETNDTFLSPRVDKVKKFQCIYLNDIINFVEFEFDYFERPSPSLKTELSRDMSS